MPIQDIAREVARKAGAWPGVVLAITISIVSYASNSGKQAERIDQMERRLSRLESNVVNRQEMDDVKAWLTRIEGKLDRALGPRGAR